MRRTLETDSGDRLTVDRTLQSSRGGGHYGGGDLGSEFGGFRGGRSCSNGRQSDKVADCSSEMMVAESSEEMMADVSLPPLQVESRSRTVGFIVGLISEAKQVQ